MPNLPDGRSACTIGLSPSARPGSDASTSTGPQQQRDDPRSPLEEGGATPLSVHPIGDEILDIAGRRKLSGSRPKSTVQLCVGRILTHCLRFEPIEHTKHTVAVVLAAHKMDHAHLDHGITMLGATHTASQFSHSLKDLAFDLLEHFVGVPVPFASQLGLGREARFGKVALDRPAAIDDRIPCARRSPRLACPRCRSSAARPATRNNRCQ